MSLDDTIGQLAPHPVECAAARGILEPRDRRLRSQGLAGDRVPIQQQLVDGVVGKVLGIVAVRMTAGDAVDPLTDQVLQRVPNPLRRARVDQTPGERLDEAEDALGRLEQDGSAIGAGLGPVEGGDDTLVHQVRKQNSL